MLLMRHMRFTLISFESVFSFMLITDPQALAEFFDWRVTPVDLGSAPGGKLAKGDSSRVYIGFSLDSIGSETFVTPKPPAANFRGYSLTTSNTPLQFWFSVHGAMVCSEWFGFAFAGGFVVNVIEVVYRPRLIIEGIR